MEVLPRPAPEAIAAAVSSVLSGFRRPFASGLSRAVKDAAAAIAGAHAEGGSPPCIPAPARILAILIREV